MTKRVLPVIICGGSGTRLWPMSRASFPKQYLKVNQDESLTFLQKTVLRISSFENVKDPIIICNEEHRFIVAEQMRSIKIKPKAIILEPIGRNTAPALTIAALKAAEEDKESILIILPADHIINNLDNFFKSINSAIGYVKYGKIITFGIVPDKPETGYGYIESLKELDTQKLIGQDISRFIEKPDLELAKKLIVDKKITWNSGIFLFKSKILIQEIKRIEPDIYKYSREALSKSVYDLDFQRLDIKPFAKCKNISIDKAIMERTNLGMVVPLNAGWTDIGNWKSLWEISTKDNSGNVSSGRVIKRNVSNSYLRGEDRLVVALNIDNLVVIDTKDVILIANKNKPNEVKDVVEYLVSKNEDEGCSHKQIYRPWGNYLSIADGECWQVKKIIVYPGESLSLQMHCHRAEHWIVVKGQALVEIDGSEKLIEENQSSYIPKNIKHRLSNPGSENLIIIEVQSGDYLGEDDIKRFEDKYGRL